MSLDVYLYEQTETTQKCVCSECGHEHDHTYRKKLFNANITHNLGKMAKECGIYKIVWRPDENYITHAAQLIEPLEKAIGQLASHPEIFEKLNSENGYGTYEGFLNFITRYYEACVKYPDAKIEVSR